MQYKCMVKTSRVGAEEVGLRCHCAAKSFGGQTALTGASFECPAGVVTALIGPNGAGKSTLFRAAVGLVGLDAGEIAVRGHPAGMREAQRRVSFMPEQPDLYPGVSVWEHVVFVALLYRLSKWRRRAVGLLERFGLADRRDALAHELSQGMRRRLALVMALVRGADVLLLDEPFNGLDPRNAAELRSLVGELAEGGVSVLVATHVLGDVDRLAKRAIVLQGGAVTAHGTLAELRASAGAHGEADLETTYLALTSQDPSPHPAAERPR